MNQPSQPASGNDSAPDGIPCLLPWDGHNQRLRDLTHPADWVQPEPAERYNLVVVGGGTAGLVTAAGAAGLGARVALVERHLLGGDCLNTGCVPSKALLAAARAAAAVRAASEFGIHVGGEVRVDFAAVMERMRRLRAELAPHDSARRFRELGVDVFLGAGRFTGPDQLEVAGRTLRFAKAVIATGARAAIPTIPGLDTVPYLTHETVFSLTELPRRLGILGAGPIGCEMAQCFARLGSEVTLFESGRGLLPSEDRDAARVIADALARDGVRRIGKAGELRVLPAWNGLCLQTSGPPETREWIVDKLLIATGRVPNTEGLGLETAGVETGTEGIRVDAHLRTTNPRIFACGDVCSSHRFTHAADFQARIVLRNALFRGRSRADALTIPWCTYTSPELAQVGLTAEEAARRGIAIDTFTQELNRVDRAVLDGETEGFVKVHVARGTDRILGATVVAAHAGDLISELTVAMKGRLGLGKIGETIHPYPTQADAIRRLGDQYSRTRLTPNVRKLFERWLAWQRS
jgi:pyruvate/2-oxoglutarate dehydrogenase complex dihydrolipoamide dehydrogenase (E3) component